MKHEEVKAIEQWLSTLEPLEAAFRAREIANGFYASYQKYAKAAREETRRDAKRASLPER